MRNLSEIISFFYQMHFEFLVKLYNCFINRYYIMILIKEKKRKYNKKKGFLLDLFVI